MSPASNLRGRLPARLATELATQLLNGEAITECSILTEIGVRVPDVAWESSAFLEAHGNSTPFPRAPEICAEIKSPSNSDDEIQEKVQAYWRLVLPRYGLWARTVPSNTTIAAASWTAAR